LLSRASHSDQLAKNQRPPPMRISDCQLERRCVVEEPKKSRAIRTQYIEMVGTANLSLNGGMSMRKPSG
jgi:hypothetical protein